MKFLPFHSVKLGEIRVIGNGKDLSDFLPVPLADHGDDRLLVEAKAPTIAPKFPDALQKIS